MTDVETTRTEDFLYVSSNETVRPAEVEEEMRRITGIEEIELCADGVRVSYVPQLISPSFISGELVKLGLVKQVSKRKGMFGRMIDRMAARNEKNFGSRPLDCCSLNRGCDNR